MSSANQSDTTIYYWPDGTWCYASEYNEVSYSFKGDDYGVIKLDENLDETGIDRMVDSLVTLEVNYSCSR